MNVYVCVRGVRACVCMGGYLCECIFMYVCIRMCMHVFCVATYRVGQYYDIIVYRDIKVS